MFNSIINSIPIKPYYRDEQADIVIYCADCRDILPLIPDKSIDLVLTDPDYNAKDIGPHHREYIGGMPYLSGREYKKWCKGWFKLARKVTDNLVFSCGIKGPFSILSLSTFSSGLFISTIYSFGTLNSGRVNL